MAALMAVAGGWSTSNKHELVKEMKNKMKQNETDKVK